MKLVIATNKTDSTNERFTEECLKEMVKTTNIPIFNNTEHEKEIGTLLDCEFDDVNLIGNVELNETIKGYIVPSFLQLEAEVVGGVLVHKKINMFALVLTNSPADKYTTSVNLTQE